MSYLFCGDYRHNSYCYEVFEDCAPQVNQWDVSKVEGMMGIFQGNRAFNSAVMWDVKIVTEMESMFNGATSFNGDMSG
jgi:hypothetical protein